MKGCIEEMTKNVLKHLNEEQSGEMYSQSAASSHSPAPPFVDSQEPRESNWALFLDSKIPRAVLSGGKTGTWGAFW